MQAFTSKKFIVALLTGILVAVNDAMGMPLTAETITMIAGVAATYIVGQGVADVGKEKAKAEAAQPKPYNPHR